MRINRNSLASYASGATSVFEVPLSRNSCARNFLANNAGMLLNQNHDWSTTGRSYVVHKRRHQRPKVSSIGPKWRITYWDYSSGGARRRTKVWSKTLVHSHWEAQSLADQFMFEVNSRNNQPEALVPARDTIKTLYESCRQLTWKHLKNSTQGQYEFLFTTYILPEWGDVRLKDLRTMELQKFFNSFHPRLSPKTIRLMHGSLRTALSQAVVWELIAKNPAIGVKLPRRKTRKAPLVLSLPDIRRMIEALPEPSKSVVTLIVFASLRIGEVLGLRWNRVKDDRLVIIERVYDGEFDEVKTDAGHRQVPFDQRGVIAEVLKRCRARAKFLGSEDLVFANRAGKPIDRHNLLNRQIKVTAVKLGLPKGIDFRSFRTMHCSLMLRTGARPEVTRDNMGHANIDVTQNVYGRSWWEERVEAVTRTIDAVFCQLEPQLESPDSAAVLSN
jgi:integrase